MSLDPYCLHQVLDLPLRERFFQCAALDLYCLAQHCQPHHCAVLRYLGPPDHRFLGHCFLGRRCLKCYDLPQIQGLVQVDCRPLSERDH